MATGEIWAVASFTVIAMSSIAWIGWMSMKETQHGRPVRRKRARESDGT